MKKTIFALTSFVFIAITVALVITMLLLKRHSPRENIKVITDQVSITGIVRTTGLVAEEKQTMHLQASDFQIETETLFPYKRVFLETGDLSDIQNLIAKCITALVEIDKDFATHVQNDTYEGQYTYGGIPVNVISISGVSADNCMFPKNNVITSVDKPITLEGHIIRIARPPDIGYDYMATLDKPIFGFDASGQNLPVYKVLVVPGNGNMLTAFEAALSTGIRVKLEGDIGWGYAESTVVTVLSLEKLN